MPTKSTWKPPLLTSGFIIIGDLSFRLVKASNKMKVHERVTTNREFSSCPDWAMTHFPPAFWTIFVYLHLSLSTSRHPTILQWLRSFRLVDFFENFKLWTLWTIKIICWPVERIYVMLWPHDNWFQRDTMNVDGGNPGLARMTTAIYLEHYLESKQHWLINFEISGSV